ncbi:hypothetical protein [Desulfovibrio inopinatus]|uniref:hypothetical protein n=1 Tax=Desulfovibrio inopinatus TaxID=102109 RepID=UPI00040ABAE4|nr:hypothetical protein [Desulfovibrio inopinatus]
MSLLGINGYGNYQFTGLTTGENNTDGSNQQRHSVSQSSPHNNQGYASANQTTGLSALSRLKNVLNSVPPDDDGRVTHSSIKEYKESLEVAFRGTVTEGLLSLGVSEDVEFSLKTDPSTGKMSVYTQDEDKEVIEAYFAANPELASQFEKIQVLAATLNQTETKVSRPLLRQDLQLQFSSYWTENASDLSASVESSIYQYNSGIFSSLRGLNTFV